MEMKRREFLVRSITGVGSVLLGTRLSVAQQRPVMFDPYENVTLGKTKIKVSRVGLGTDNGRRVYFDFDGVMAFPKVYVNGQLAGQWDYGYMSFRVDATPYVKFGVANVIAVHVDTRNHGTRWYPGAGIYRKVTMTVCDPLHIAALNGLIGNGQSNPVPFTGCFSSGRHLDCDVRTELGER